MTATTAAPTWKNPRILLKHLTTWVARDDTRPDPQARAAAIAALDAVNDMIAELAALGARLTGEIAAEDMRQEMAAEAQAAEESRAGEAAPDAGPRPGATGQWPVAATEDGSVLPEGWTEYTCMGCGAAYSAKPFDVTPHRCAPDADRPWGGTFTCFICATMMPMPTPGEDRACPKCATVFTHPAGSTVHIRVPQEDPPPLYAVPKLYSVPGAGWVLQDPATCPHRNGMPDSEAGTWHCHDCGSDVYDDEQLAAIQAGFVSAAPVRAVADVAVAADLEG